VRQVPPGKVTTYGQVAASIAPPPGVLDEDFKLMRARWVGQAMAQCPDDVPWQRVINSEGKISPRPGADLQRQLLEAEGVIFDARERVDLKRFGWSNSDNEQLSLGL
jgi:methylated-DNA-protein-cysteine methyltransferase related protein